MRKSKFTVAQMVSIVREADRDKSPRVAERHGVGEQTIDTWRKRFGAFEAMQRLRTRRRNAAEKAGVGTAVLLHARAGRGSAGIQAHVNRRWQALHPSPQGSGAGS